MHCAHIFTSLHSHMCKQMNTCICTHMHLYVHFYNTLTHLHSHKLHVHQHTCMCGHNGTHAVKCTQYSAYTREDFHGCTHLHEHIFTAHTLACLHTCHPMYTLHPHTCDHTQTPANMHTLHICMHLHMHRPTYTRVMTLTRTHKNSGSSVLRQNQLCPPSPIQAILFPSLDFEFQLPPIPYLSPLSGQLMVSP